MRKTPLPTAVSLLPLMIDPASRIGMRGMSPWVVASPRGLGTVPVVGYLMRAFSRVVSSVGRSSSFLRPKPKL